jgi:hypothetical protein
MADCSPAEPGGVSLRIYPDQLPDTSEKAEQFRSYIVALEKNPDFRARRISIATSKPRLLVERTFLAPRGRFPVGGGPGTEFIRTRGSLYRECRTPL